MDITIAKNRFAYLGSEFLTWLWFSTDHKRANLNVGDGEINLEPLNKIVLTRYDDDGAEIVTIKGNGSDMNEAKVAMRKGAMVTEANFKLVTYANMELEWTFNIKHDTLQLSAIKTPPMGPASGDDLEGGIMEKIYLLEKPVEIIYALFQKFVQLRRAPDFNVEYQEMYEWVGRDQE